MSRHSTVAMRRLAATAILVLCVMYAGAESPNPFTSSGGPSRMSAPASGGIAVLAPVLRAMTDRLAELARQVRESNSPGPMLTLALISLAYGIFHALGPGHGKTIVSTFFLAEEAKLRHSLIAGYLIALVHAVSALAIVLTLFFIVQGVFSTGFESASRIVQTLSFGAIAVIGAVMLVQRIRGVEHSHAPGKGHTHDHSHADDQDGEPRQVTFKELFGIALASGVVPCPGASAIILVCLSLNVLLAGIVAVVMISIGMGMTVTVIGSTAILVKRGVLKASSGGHGGGARIVRRIVEIAGASVLFAFGLSLFVAQLI